MSSARKPDHLPLDVMDDVERRGFYHVQPFTSAANADSHEARMPKATTQIPLTAAEKVAISKAVGAAAVTKAREAIPNGKTIKIDLTLRITGTLVRDAEIPAGTKQVTEQLQLDGAAVLAAALRKCGVAKADFETAYTAAKEAHLKRLAQDQAKVRPKSVPTDARDGDINVTLDVVRI
mgnify:CR=1 FL=1